MDKRGTPAGVALMAGALCTPAQGVPIPNCFLVRSRTCHPYTGGNKLPPSHPMQGIPRLGGQPTTSLQQPRACEGCCRGTESGHEPGGAGVKGGVPVPLPAPIMNVHHAKSTCPLPLTLPGREASVTKDTATEALSQQEAE